MISKETSVVLHGSKSKSKFLSRLDICLFIHRVRWVSLFFYIYIPSDNCRTRYCIKSHLFPRVLGHGVEGATVLEPLNLSGIESVCKLDVKGLAAIGWVNNESNVLANSEFRGKNVNGIVGTDLVIVFGCGEGQRKHTLLLQVGLVLRGVSSCYVSNL
jgi:hypothetical protein